MLDADEQSRVVAAGTARGAQFALVCVTVRAIRLWGFTPTMEHVPVISDADLYAGYDAVDPRQYTDAQLSMSLFAEPRVRPRVSGRISAGRARCVVTWHSAPGNSARGSVPRATALAQIWAQGTPRRGRWRSFASLASTGMRSMSTCPSKSTSRCCVSCGPICCTRCPSSSSASSASAARVTHPSGSWFWGDLAPRPWRRAMERRIGMAEGHIVDVFGSIEVGAIAYSDDEHGRYLMHEHIIPEQIPPAYSPGRRWPATRHHVHGTRRLSRCPLRDRRYRPQAETGRSCRQQALGLRITPGARRDEDQARRGPEPAYHHRANWDSCARRRLGRATRRFGGRHRDR